MYINVELLCVDRYQHELIEFLRKYFVGVLNSNPIINHSFNRTIDLENIKKKPLNATTKDETSPFQND